MYRFKQIFRANFKFTRRDPHRKKLNLAWLNLALRIKFSLLVKGRAWTALCLLFTLCIPSFKKRLRAQRSLFVMERSDGSEHSEAKQRSSLLYPPFSFSWVAEGALLRLRLVTTSRPTYALFTATSEAVSSPQGDGSERSEAKSRAPFSFASCYALATAKGRPAPVCLQLLAQRRRSPL